MLFHTVSSKVPKRQTGEDYEEAGARCAAASIHKELWGLSRS
jgi:hypothetical protein